MTSSFSLTSQLASQDLSVGDLVSGYPYLRLRADYSIETILSIMASSGKRVAAVVDFAGRYQGFVTRSGLLGKLVIDQSFDVAQRIETSLLGGLTAGDVMIPNAAFLPSELSIDDSLAIMGEYGFHAMPVLGDGGELLGIAEMGDLVMAQKGQNEKTEDYANDDDIDLLSGVLAQENLRMSA